MIILALDTSSPYLSLAVFKNGKLLAERRQKNRKLLTPTTARWINKTLKEKKIKLKDVDGFITGLGPGYFTSLRIGLAAIKGFAFALQKPVAGVSSLDLIKEGLKEKEGQICVVTDAKRNLFYTAIYSCQNGVCKKTKPDSLLKAEQVMEGLKGKVVFAGEGIPLLKDGIKNNKKINAVFADEKYWYPKAKYALILGEESLTKAKADSGMKLVPAYLFAEDCQVHK